MKKTMSILLIILGSILLICGFFGICSKKSSLDNDHLADLPLDSLHSMNEDTLSESEQKGQQFEDYIISRFSPSDYTLVEKVNDYTSRHHSTERSKYADLVFRKKDTGEEFAVECKYRSGWIDSNGKPALLWVNQRKIDDYNRFSDERDIDVIIVFGVGGLPASPDEVFSLPLRVLQKPYPPYKEMVMKFKVADGPLQYNARQHNLHIFR